MNARSVLPSLFAMVIGMAILSCTGSHAQLKAIYLVANGGGQLSESDLRAHPEVIVANSQQELADHVESQVAIWIDKNAVKLVDLNWLQVEPQKYYPISLIGYNDPLYSFREQLTAFGISGPYVDWSTKHLEPGFSIWKLTQQTNSSTSAYMRGFAEPPTVERLLLVTNALLKDEPPPGEVP
jgi:hypothetical protein